MLAAGCGTNQDWTNSEEPVFHPTIFSNCTFVGNSALDTGGASEIATGRARFYNTTFVRNIANVGGALRLFGTVELLNSSFFDNRSGEGGGSAISNTGVISEMIGLEFSANRFICTDNEYADFSEASVVEFPADVPPCRSSVESKGMISSHTFWRESSPVCGVDSSK